MWFSIVKIQESLSQVNKLLIIRHFFQKTMSGRRLVLLIRYFWFYFIPMIRLSLSSLMIFGYRWYWFYSGGDNRFCWLKEILKNTPCKWPILWIQQINSLRCCSLIAVVGNLPDYPREIPGLLYQVSRAHQTLTSILIPKDSEYISLFYWCLTFCHRQKMF